MVNKNMEIKLDSNHCRYELVVKDTNIQVKFTASEGVWKDSKRVGEDISDDVLNKFSPILEELFYYRKRKFDSSNMIKEAFKNLNEDVKKELLDELIQDLKTK